MSRNPERIDEVIEEVKKYWKENPDLRLGQLIFILSSKHNNIDDPFYMEDDELLQTLKNINNND